LSGIQITHPFVSAKADGTDNTLVRPSNWNANHTITLDAFSVVGNPTNSAGPAQEIPVTAATISLLSQADIASILNYLGISPPTTGDAKLTLKTTADPGWIMLDDSNIGNPTSGASHASAANQALFTLLFNNLNDTWAPIFTANGAAQTSRPAQGSAATAWANSCIIVLPKVLGRAIIGGVESHALVAGEIPTITSNQNSLGVSVSGGGNLAASNGTVLNGGFSGGSGANIPYSNNGVFGGVSTLSGSINVNVVSNNTGGGAPAHNNMQPYSAWNVMLKQ
jgi:hypothetical protein